MIFHTNFSKFMKKSKIIESNRHFPIFFRKFSEIFGKCHPSEKAIWWTDFIG